MSKWFKKINKNAIFIRKHVLSDRYSAFHKVSSSLRVRDVLNLACLFLEQSLGTRYLILDIEYSIQHSKKLEEYKKKYPYCRPFFSEQCQEIFKAKNISDDNSRFYVGKTLKQLHCTRFSEIFIQKQKNEKYSSKNERHETKLLELWKNLKPEQELRTRCSDQWISVGFQGNDPASDFRGAGALGLLNLWMFSKKSPCKQLFELATHPKTGFFFCSAGLFFTLLAFDLLKSRKISYDYWVHNDEQEIINKFQVIYETLFKQFTKFWLTQCENTQIIYLNQNLKNFEEDVKKWNPKIIKYHIECQQK